MTLTATQPHKIYLAGQWVDSPDPLEVANPADPGNPAGATYNATEAQYEEAVDGRRRRVPRDARAAGLRAEPGAARDLRGDQGAARGARADPEPGGGQAHPRRARGGGSSPSSPSASPPRRRSGCSAR